MRNSMLLLRAFLLMGALMAFQTTDASTTDYSSKFVRIEVDQIGDEVLIRWLTDSEYDLDFFTIQRSLDNGNIWQSLGTVQSSGVTPGSDTYEFKDLSPASGTVKYRIRQTDFDGTYDYSFVVDINVTFFTNTDDYAVQLYPNPAEEEVVISGGDLSEMAIVKMMDISGKLIEVDLDVTDTQITVRPVSKLFGLYFLMIADQNKTTIKKVKFE